MSDTILNNSIRGLFAEITEYYQRIPSKEIWTSNTIENLLRLIEYFYELGDFEDQETAVLLCDQLADLIDQLKTDAIHGMKNNYKSGKFELYHSEIALENNFILIQDKGEAAVFLKLYSINSMFTTNESFCKDTVLWLQNIINKSTPLSGSSQRQCYAFFRHCNNMISETKKRILQFEGSF